MNKLMIVLFASAFSVAMSGTVVAAEQATDKSATDAKSNTEKDKADLTYSADLKKCDSLKGTEKQSCEDKVRGAHGKM